MLYFTRDHPERDLGMFSMFGHKLGSQMRENVGHQHDIFWLI